MFIKSTLLFAIIAIVISKGSYIYHNNVVKNNNTTTCTFNYTHKKLLRNKINIKKEKNNN